MPKMRWADAEAFDDLPDDWDDSGIEPYEGDDPPPNIVLRGAIKKVWAVQFQTGTDGLKVLFEAADNDGDKAEYDGWASWDNIVFTPGAAFRYGPFLELLGITLRDIRIAVVGEEDNVGFPLVKAGSFRMPEDGVPCKVRTKAENSKEYGRSIKTGTYLPDEPSKKSRKSGKAKSKAAAPRRRTRDDDIDDDDVPF